MLYTVLQSILFKKLGFGAGATSSFARQGVRAQIYKEEKINSKYFLIFFDCGLFCCLIFSTVFALCPHGLKWHKFV
jgi:hypothetical protein